MVGVCPPFFITAWSLYMYNLKIFIAASIVIFKCKIGMGGSFTKGQLRKLLWNIDDDKLFMRVIYAYLSNIQDGSISDMMDKRNVLEYFFQGINLLPSKRCLILQVLIKNPRFSKYLSHAAAISLIESAAYVVYESRVSTIERRLNNPLIMHRNALYSLAITKLMLDIITEHDPSYCVLKNLMHDCLINESVEPSDIINILTGQYNRVLHKHLPELEKRYIYLLCRYGTMKQIQDLMDERNELRGITRFYLERYKNVNKNIKSVVRIKTKQF